MAACPGDAIYGEHEEDFRFELAVPVNSREKRSEKDSGKGFGVEGLHETGT